MPRHLLRTLDLGPAQLARILDLAAHLKADPFARSDLLRRVVPWPVPPARR